MRTPRTRMLVGAAGAMAVLCLSACGSGDSTVSAPSAGVPTTSVAASASTSSVPSSAGSSSSSAPGGSLPATAPQVDASVPAGFPGGAPAPQGSRGSAYLAALRQDGVTVPNDPDNSIALGAAEFVCSERAKNSPDAQIKTFVTAIVASGTTDPAAASATADKVIAAATSTYCR